MRERTRQRLLQSGQAVSLKRARELVRNARSRSWSGCLSGTDWCGCRIYCSDLGQSSRSEHIQNDAPTGWEQRGSRVHLSADHLLRRGQTLRIITRSAIGRNGDGDSLYRSSTQLLDIV